jgi:hypothetical protein
MAENFLALCASGYYDCTIFHGNKGFMVQGHDPTAPARAAPPSGAASSLTNSARRLVVQTLNLLRLNLQTFAKVSLKSHTVEEIHAWYSR